MESIQEKILEILNANIVNTEITFEQTEKDLSAMGMDSITFIRLIVALEEEFDIEVPDEKLLITEMNTIAKIVNVITAILNSKYESQINFTRPS